MILKALAGIDRLEKEARKLARAAHARQDADFDAWYASLSREEGAEFWTRLCQRHAEMGVVPEPPANFTELQLTNDPVAVAYDKECAEIWRTPVAMGSYYGLAIETAKVWQAYKDEGHPASGRYRY